MRSGFLQDWQRTAPLLPALRCSTRLYLGLLLGFVVVGGVGNATAQTEDEDTHNVTPRVQAYSAIDVSPATSFVTDPGRSKVVESTYSVVSNVSALQQIVVSLRGAAPKGIAIWVDIEPPEGAEEVEDGPVKLVGASEGARSRTLVTGIGQVSERGLRVSYTTEVTISAKPGDKQVRLEFELVK